MDLADYYEQESDDELSLILQDTVSSSKGRIKNGVAYIPIRLSQENWTEDFTGSGDTADALYSAGRNFGDPAGEQQLCQRGETVTEEYPIVSQIDGEYYIALDFLEQYMEIQSRVYENPARAVILYKWGTVQTVDAREDAQVRYQGGIKSPILADVKAGQQMILLEELDNWSRVMTEDGIDGYIENSAYHLRQKRNMPITAAMKKTLPV